MRFHLLFILCLCCLTGNVEAQKDSIRTNQIFGKFIKWNSASLIINSAPDSKEPVELVCYSHSGNRVWYKLLTPVQDSSLLQFIWNKEALTYEWKTGGRVLIYLPVTTTKHQLKVVYDDIQVDEIQVSRLKKKTLHLAVLRSEATSLDEALLERGLDSLFAPAFIDFDVRIIPFKNDGFDPKKKLQNPSPARLRYTRQMIHIRDLVLLEEGSRLNGQLAFVEIGGFSDSLIREYMVKDKALGFVVGDSLSGMLKALEKALRAGFLNSTIQGAPIEIDQLTDDQRYALYQFPEVFSFMDEYEEVRTNNGLVAYYTFETDERGNILHEGNSFLNAINRPIKKNTFSYHLQIDNFLFKPLFFIQGFRFNLLHLLAFAIILVSWFYLGRKIRKWFRLKFRRSGFWRFTSVLFQYLTLPVLGILAYLLIDQGYNWFVVTNGEIEAYRGLKMDQVLDRLMLNVNPTANEVPAIGSELVVKKGEHYELLQRKPVLYFEMQEKTEGSVLRLVSSSDSIRLPKYNFYRKAQSHYLVLSVKDEKGILIRQQLFNHLGIDLTHKLRLADPPKRILVFVNGYRPTSIGNTFEENFKDIRQNGLEFPNSLNRLFTSDRYNYWHPWNQIDEQFKARLNPTEVYYADGHHSVSTSNHRSILNFTSNSSNYPKRCADLNKHTCYITKSVKSTVFGTKRTSTYDLLATKPNKNGFKIRKNSGRIAGRNLYQLLNELPNTSSNDTLYLVVHSMGFAYAQGMIDYLRGKIQFGSYYILAPENAASGTVDVSEWKQIWQYGSNLNAPYPDAPCLQDGVAPQVIVKGLPTDHRIMIPASENKHKGYFDSHFIGYYQWVLSIPEATPGYLRQL